MTSNSILAIYDFEIFPYALGDVLTWNVRTAMRCDEVGRGKVDIYICLDERYPAGIYQQGLINGENYELFFTELYSTFGTHPRLGNIFIFRSRDSLLERLGELARSDRVAAREVADYVAVLENDHSKLADRSRLHKIFSAVSRYATAGKLLKAILPTSMAERLTAEPLKAHEVRNAYFVKYIHSHSQINAFAEKWGQIPLLAPVPGCQPDVEEVINARYAKKKVVPFHLRLRRLDIGYGGDHSYDRDSNFLEWYDFLRKAAQRYPEVEFVAMGRLQEKPHELMDLPNVSSLRDFGLGLGHELTLLAASDLFIGTSSGFAAYANFCKVPYFITKMSEGACYAYDIPIGADRLPFATDRQKLVYADETSEMLMDLLREGLDLPAHEPTSDEPRETGSAVNQDFAATPIDLRGWIIERSQRSNAASTTSRFTRDPDFRKRETAYLLLHNLGIVRKALIDGNLDIVQRVMDRMRENFPDVCASLPLFQMLVDAFAEEKRLPGSMKKRLELLDTRAIGIYGAPCETEPAHADSNPAWRPLHFAIDGCAGHHDLDQPQPAFRIRAARENAYWHTEKFVASSRNGEIAVRFDARSSETPSRHTIWIFENGSYRTVGEFVSMPEWQSFNIPVMTLPNKVLEFQIDQGEKDQWLIVRDFRIEDAERLPVAEADPVLVPLDGWMSAASGGQPIGDDPGFVREWEIVGPNGYIKSPVLPPRGEVGLRMTFEAKADAADLKFVSIYLFEGENNYRAIGHMTFDPSWREYSIFLEPKGDSPLQMQIDFPPGAKSFSIRNCRAIRTDRPRPPEDME